MIRLLLLSALLPTTLVACKDQRADLPTPTRKGRKSPNARASDRGQEQRVCESLLQQFAAVLQAGGACKAETDCTCYSGLSDCGGVTDGKTARRLGTIIQLFRLAKCTRKTNCAARACRAACVSSRCVQTQVGAKPSAGAAPARVAQRPPDSAREPAAIARETPRLSPTQEAAETRRRRAMIAARHQAMIAARDRSQVVVKLYATDW